MRNKLVRFGLMVLIALPCPGAAQDKSAGVNSYHAKGCMQIEDTLVCGAAEIAAAVAALLAAAQAAQAASKAKPKLCRCICNPGGKKKELPELMPEYECRATCVMQHGFVYGDYSCK